MTTKIKITNSVLLMMKDDETKDSIEAAQSSPSAGSQIDTAQFSSIAAVTIVATKYPVFPSTQVPSNLSSISTSRKPSTIAAVNILATRAPVDIVIIKAIDKGKLLVQPVPTTFLPSSKVPNSLYG